MFGGQIVAAQTISKKYFWVLFCCIAWSGCKKVSNEQKRFAVNLNISLENLRIYLR